MTHPGRSDVTHTGRRDVGSAEEATLRDKAHSVPHSTARVPAKEPKLGAQLSALVVGMVPERWVSSWMCGSLCYAKRVAGSMLCYVAGSSLGLFLEIWGGKS